MIMKDEKIYTVKENGREIKRRSKVLRGIKDKKLSTKLKQAYYNMKRRCYDEKNVGYKYYGEKGIRVCNEWLNNRDSFYVWSLENGFKEGKSLDRINYCGNYSPDNCRWVDDFVQSNNKSNNIWIEYNGEIHTIAQWARILNLDVRIAYARWEHGSNPERILSKENLNHRPVLQIDKDTGNIIAEYPTAIAASKSVGFKNDHISRACNGKRISAAGYYWAYKGGENKPRRKPSGKKPVMCISEDNNETKSFQSLKEAARELGCNAQTISRACESGRKYFGYYWKTIGEDENDNSCGSAEKVAQEWIRL